MPSVFRANPIISAITTIFEPAELNPGEDAYLDGRRQGREDGYADGFDEGFHAGRDEPSTLDDLEAELRHEYEMMQHMQEIRDEQF